MRYHHIITGREYESRGEPYPYDFGDHTLMKVPVTDENGRSTVVYLGNLEPLDTETIPAAPNLPRVGAGRATPDEVGQDFDSGPEPPSTEVQREFEKQERRRDIAMELAGDLSFHAGNALMEILYGNLDFAMGALVAEKRRRYPAANTPEEAIHD